MLGQLRKFSTSKFAFLLTAIIIVPFVFWGMGSVFSGGTSNVVARINNVNISTEEYIDYLNFRNIDSRVLKENLDKNIIEDNLNLLISKTLLDQEIKRFKINLTDKSLLDKIKLNPLFKDDKNKFSRVKYEKYLIENNTSAVQFEKNLKNNELQNKLYSYVGGGIKSPKFFINKFHDKENKIIDYSYINMNKNYKKNFSNSEIDKFIKSQKDNLKRDYITFSYAKITPKNLIDENDFNEKFFQEIDDIENQIFSGVDINLILKKYNIILTKKKDITKNDKLTPDENEIFKKSKKTQNGIMDKNDYYLIYNVSSIKRLIPDISDDNFKREVINKMLINEKYKFNLEVLQKMQKGEFTQEDFINLSKKSELINSSIKSINENDLFNKDSLKLLFSLKPNSYLLMTDDNQNVYAVKINNSKNINLNKASNNYELYSNITNAKMINDLYNSYDILLNKDYKIKIFEKNLERVKNYFK